MKKISMVVLAMFLAVGCKDKWDKAISDMNGFKDEMCACKDKACTDGVKKKMNDWEEKMSKEFGKDEKPPEKLMEKGDAIEKEMKACRKKIEKEAGGAKAAEALKKMTGFKDAMCACKDAACAQKVTDDMTAWSKAQAADVDSMGAMDEDTTKKMTDVSNDLGKCMTTAMTPPAAGSATP
ncbi:MAG: hypothetical protein QM831_21590 [Kofleriaceae bacterium]